MMATRTLAVSSGLGALFLLHGCGEKSVSDGAAPVDADTPPPVAPTDVSTTTPDAPAAPDSGSWSDVSSLITELTNKNEIREFMNKMFNPKVEIDSSPDGNIFPAHTSKNTVSVVLNDWRDSKKPGNAKTAKDIESAFTPKDESAEEIYLNGFSGFHTVIQDPEHIYVADPAILDEAVKYTQSVFFKMPYHSNAYTRADDDKKQKSKKEKMTDDDTNAWSMVVVFTGKHANQYPFRNRNNFAMALVNPKSVSSPVDVFKSSLDTFDILLTVIAATQKMQNQNEDKYEFIDLHRKYKVKNSEDEDDSLNWWGCYTEVDERRRDEHPEKIKTKYVGGQSPKFGASRHDDDDAEKKLKDITKAFKQFFVFKKGIDLAGRTNGPLGTARNVVHMKDSRFAGACKELEDSQKFIDAVEEYQQKFDAANAAEKQKLTIEFEQWRQKLENEHYCEAHEKHEHSMYWRVRSAAFQAKQPPNFDNYPAVRCPREEEGADNSKITECLLKATKAIHTYAPYNSLLMKQILHEVQYVDNDRYAKQIHKIQTAIIDFYDDYEDTENNKRSVDGEFTDSIGDGQKTLGDDLKAPVSTFMTHAVITHPFNMGVEHAKCPAIDDIQLVAGATNWLSVEAADGPRSYITAAEIGNKKRPIHVWEPLFKFLGEYDDDSKVSEIIPGDKQAWQDRFHKKRTVKVSDDILFEWPEYRFPSHNSLASAEIKRIYIGVQSAQAEVNAALYAGLAVQFWKKIDRDEDKTPEFYMAVKTDFDAKNKNSKLKGEGRLKGEHQKTKKNRIPAIVLAGSEWSDAKIMVDALFSDKKAKKQQGGSISAGGF